MALLVFDHPEGWVADDDIDLGFRLIGQGIGLGQVAKTSGLKFSPAIWIQFIGDHPGWIGTNQQRSIPCCRLINRFFSINSTQD
ncbi:hypothetical protein C7293_21845 [filamentous cyanobacterium CCT1]|nr:hypothetical protein C7293_21845 [filamentous cyanobacterium CCT1]PSN78338.1 hypothetical protein C8B47_17435 [filamentous cyanobacterium CCP4]